MTEQEMQLLDYKELLKEIEGQECHLLLGNGFNNSLDVNTSYQAIFQKMLSENHGIYRDTEVVVKQCGYDLEKFIEKLLIDIDDTNKFLKKYVENKVKHDFMKSAHEIVKSEIKNVYAENNEGIFTLFQNFSNYFTLNFDSFLYLLLLNFKKADLHQAKTIAVQASLKFIQDDLDDQLSQIYTKVLEARTNGHLKIQINDSESDNLLQNCTKSEFETVVKRHFRDKGWSGADIKRVSDYIWEEEKQNNILEDVEDGFDARLFPDLTFNIKQDTQNLFFLHGAFHIYQDKNTTYKITQGTHKALYDKLEEILNTENKEIVCVFQSENKIEKINKNPYLKKSYEKLEKLTGAMVIIGWRMDKNDGHIINQINKSSVKRLYVSSKEYGGKSHYEKMKELFPDKEITLFDRETITYELPDK